MSPPRVWFPKGALVGHFPSEDGLGVSNVRPSTIKQKVLDHQTANQKRIQPLSAHLYSLCPFPFTTVLCLYNKGKMPQKSKVKKLNFQHLHLCVLPTEWPSSPVVR